MRELVDWDVFKKTSDYQKMSEKGKQAIAHLYLDDIKISEESLLDFIAFDKGEISAEETKARAIKRATDGKTPENNKS